MKRIVNLLHYKEIALVLCTLIFIPFNLQADNSVSLGVTLNGAEWSGDNGSGRSSFSSTEGGQFGLSANVNLDQFYVGLSIQGGEYNFSSDAPDQFTSKGTVTVRDANVEHNDFDLLAGYYFWPQVSLFVDLKSATSKWKDNGYEQKLTGLGIGVSGFHPVAQNWLLFASFGLVNGNIEDNDVSNLGRGNNSALTLGAVYSIEKNQHLNFGLKFRKYNFDYDDGNTQDYTLNSLFVGYTHVIDW